MNQLLMAAQTVLPLADISVGTASVIFAQNLGSAVFVSAAETLFAQTLLHRLRTSVPELDPAVVLATSATELRTVVAPHFVDHVTAAYSDSLVPIFCMAVALAALTFVGAAAMEWRSVKKAAEREKTGEEQGSI